MRNRDYHAMCWQERVEALARMTPAQLQEFVLCFEVPAAWSPGSAARLWQEIALHAVGRLDPRLCADSCNADCQCAMCEAVEPLLEANP